MEALMFFHLDYGRNEGNVGGGEHKMINLMLKEGLHGFYYSLNYLPQMKEYTKATPDKGK